MESMGDFYAIALHNDQLRAGIVAVSQKNGVARPTWIRGARSSPAAALRALAALVDAPRPTIAAEPQLDVVG